MGFEPLVRSQAARWLRRFATSFGATVALYAGAHSLAVRLQRPEMMPAAIGGLSVAMCCLGLVLYARRSGFLSPLLAGFLYGSATACGAAMLIPSFRSADIVQALVLVLSLAQAVAIFAVDLAVTRRIPNAKSLTVAAGFAVVLLIAESFLMLFFYVGWNLRIELMFNIMPVVYGVAAVIFGALAVKHLMDLLDAVELPQSDKSSKTVLVALRRFMGSALIPISLWWIISIWTWLALEGGTYPFGSIF